MRLASKRRDRKQGQPAKRNEADWRANRSEQGEAMTDGKKTEGVPDQADGWIHTRHLGEYVRIGRVVGWWASEDAQPDMTERRHGSVSEYVGPDTHEHTHPGPGDHPTTQQPRCTPESTPANNATHDGTST